MHALFKRFNRGINETWEDYITIKFYLKRAHDLVKSDRIERVSIPKLVNPPRNEITSARVIFGIIDRVNRSSSGYHAFIDAVRHFEHFMSSPVFRVCMVPDHPPDFGSDRRCLPGRRIWVSLILDFLFDDTTKAGLFDDYPQLTHEGVVAEIVGVSVCPGYPIFRIHDIGDRPIKWRYNNSLGHQLRPSQTSEDPG